jgi:hypothetical protein
MLAAGVLSDAEFAAAMAKVRGAAAKSPPPPPAQAASSTQPEWLIPVLVLAAVMIIAIIVGVVNSSSSNNSSSFTDPTADAAPATAITLASEPPPTPSQSLKGTYKLLRADDGKAFRWDSCRGPIQVAVNYGTLNTTEQAQNQALVRSALAKISTATEVTYEYAGATRVEPSYEDRGAGSLSHTAIVIGFLPSTKAMWTDPSMKDYTGQDLFGYQYALDPTTENWRAFIQGDIQILPDADDVEELLLFDLAFISGLSYVEDATSPEIMGLTMDGPQYGPGDLAGLKLVGSRECD